MGEVPVLDKEELLEECKEKLKLMPKSTDSDVEHNSEDNSDIKILLSKSNGEVSEVNIEIKDAKNTEKSINEEKEKYNFDQTKYCEIKIKKLEDLENKDKLDIPLGNT